MEESKKNSRKCVYCKNYKGYYTKALYCFNREKVGNCSRLNRIVSNNECCENWESNGRRFLSRRKVASKMLFEILTDLSAIRQIIQESKEEEKNL